MLKDKKIETESPISPISYCSSKSTIYVNASLVNTDISDQEIREYLKSQLTYFKVPKYYQRVDSFPMTVTGKVQKFKLAERAKEDFNL